MWDTPGRLLRVLELFQLRRDWGSAELAERLGVSTRTVRRDVDRLRAIGYPVDARPGIDGGYRLAPGTSLPPLMFDAEEAVAAVLALQTGSLTGNELVSGSALRALTKLTTVMPTRLRRQVDALTSSTSHTPHGTIKGQLPTAVDVNILIAGALACREHLQVDAEYKATERTLEPLHLVQAGGRWYLVAWDLTRHDWRTFRVDRFTRFELTTKAATQRTPPSEDPEAYVIAHVGVGIQQQRAIVRVHAPRASIQHWIDPAWGHIEDDGDECVLHVGADTLAGVARWLLLLDAELTVVEPPALSDEFAALAARANRTASSKNA
ncbi:MAG: Helix-turn-helix type 11 domain protein [Amycolatopsis sp.]|uniref:helix-turn-helix transcriptional regulator n=1 Tax=Amycolatopsis sp. TaxID=37632 RepID=UPI00260E8428|nr:WYL domain-containing protein [Amycolatopsis sp.]MCU1685247.1 Helix-turn-helix type 11 domain protein [Amycolatopsis sp.]